MGILFIYVFGEFGTIQMNFKNGIKSVSKKNLFIITDNY